MSSWQRESDNRLGMEYGFSTDTMKIMATSNDMIKQRTPTIFGLRGCTGVWAFVFTVNFVMGQNVRDILDRQLLGHGTRQDEDGSSVQRAATYGRGGMNYSMSRNMLS